MPTSMQQPHVMDKLKTQALTHLDVPGVPPARCTNNLASQTSVASAAGCKTHKNYHVNGGNL